MNYPLLVVLSHYALAGKLNFPKRKFQDWDKVRILSGFKTENTVADYRTMGRVIPIMMSNYVPFSATVDGDEFLFNDIAYDLDGNWVVETINNYWRRNPNYTGKFKYDNADFEILDNRNYKVLSVDFRKDTIELMGYLIKNNSLWVYGETATYVGLKPNMQLSVIDSFFVANKVRKLFRYLGPKWLHSRENNKHRPLSK